MGLDINDTEEDDDDEEEEVVKFTSESTIKLAASQDTRETTNGKVSPTLVTQFPTDDEECHVSTTNGNSRGKYYYITYNSFCLYLYNLFLPFICTLFVPSDEQHHSRCIHITTPTTY